MIFDIKLKDFRRKARLVEDGHVTKPPATITYAGVVLRDTVCVALTVAALNDFQVRTTDIHNAYIQTAVSEKIWMLPEPEFGPDAGNSVLIVRALYGIKSTGAIFWNPLADCMKHMEYISFPAYPDLRMKPMVIPSDGAEYYGYIHLYVDDILCIRHDAESFLTKVDNYFKLKVDSVGESDMYWEAKV